MINDGKQRNFKSNKSKRTNSERNKNQGNNYKSNNKNRWNKRNKNNRRGQRGGRIYLLNFFIKKHGGNKMTKLTRKVMKDIGMKEINIDTAIMGNYIMEVTWCDGKVEKYTPTRS